MNTIATSSGVGDGVGAAINAGVSAKTGRHEGGTGTAMPVSLRRLVVPTDFSEASRQAMAPAVALAREYRAALTLVYVVPSSLPAEFGHLGLVLETRRLLAEAEAAIAQFRERELPSDLNVTTVVREGGAPYQITEVARALEADLIVLSTHGYTGLRHAWMGSTAERVVRHAPCPVLTIRAREIPLRFPDDRPCCFRHILIPSDFSPTSDKALVYAAALGARCGADYRLLHVVEPPPYPEFGYAHVPAREAALRAEATERLEVEARRQLGADRMDGTTLRVRAGRASFEIAAEARESGADLIVIGTHGHSVWKQLVLGSTTEEVVRHADCPVLIVRDCEHEFIPVAGAG